MIQVYLCGGLSLENKIERVDIMLYRLLAIADVADDSISSFVTGLMEGISSKITLAQVGTVVASIVSAGIVAVFAWKFGRKGLAFLKNALSGRSGRV